MNAFRALGRGRRARVRVGVAVQDRRERLPLAPPLVVAPRQDREPERLRRDRRDRPGPNRQRDELIGIEDALASMPEQQRRAILLREWQGLSYREIAAELDVSQSAVETLIFRARRSLAQGLEQPDTVKKPKRKSFRRALHALDLGTILAAAKTLLAGSAAVKATAAAVAVTAAAGTAVTVAPQPEPKPPVRRPPRRSSHPHPFRLPRVSRLLLDRLDSGRDVHGRAPRRSRGQPRRRGLPGRSPFVPPISRSGPVCAAPRRLPAPARSTRAAGALFEPVARCAREHPGRAAGRRARAHAGSGRRGAEAGAAEARAPAQGSAPQAGGAASSSRASPRSAPTRPRPSVKRGRRRQEELRQQQAAKREEAKRERETAAAAAPTRCRAAAARDSGRRRGADRPHRHRPGNGRREGAAEAATPGPGRRFARRSPAGNQPPHAGCPCAGPRLTIKTVAVAPAPVAVPTVAPAPGAR